MCCPALHIIKPMFTALHIKMHCSQPCKRMVSYQSMAIEMHFQSSAIFKAWFHRTQYCNYVIKACKSRLSIKNSMLHFAGMYFGLEESLKRQFQQVYCTVHCARTGGSTEIMISLISDYVMIIGRVRARYRYSRLGNLRNCGIVSVAVSLLTLK